MIIEILCVIILLFLILKEAREYIIAKKVEQSLTDPQEGDTMIDFTPLFLQAFGSQEVTSALDTIVHNAIVTLWNSEEIQGSIQQLMGGQLVVPGTTPEEQAKHQHVATKAAGQLMTAAVESNPLIAFGLDKLAPSWREDAEKNPAQFSTTMQVLQRLGVDKMLANFMPADPSGSQPQRAASSGF